MSCNCGSNCGCGSDCKCGKRYPDLGISEKSTPVSVIAGLAPTKAYFEESEMGYGAENDGCKCGANCSCGASCSCGK